MFSHMACICHFVFYALPRASYGYIQCGFIPSAVWRLSNIFSSSLGVGILALNRVFSYFLVVGIVFIPGGVWMPPCSYTPICLYAPIHLYTHRGVHIPYAPILFCASVCFGGFACCGGCNGLPFVLGHHPCLGVPPLQLHPLHSVLGSLCIGMFQGYLYVMWAFPFH